MTMPTFVFVHGAASNSFGWTPLIRELAFRGQRSMALDLPGHGGILLHPAELADILTGSPNTA
ncbi:MAG: alpha/beta fold hydrolase [Pseudonocardiaceae bacterium]